MPFAFAFFSTLRPSSRIAPHHAPANLRIRVHLPLLVPEPERCGIRVAGEARTWTPGEALVFDDAFEHEVWNEGDGERVVLCALPDRYLQPLTESSPARSQPHSVLLCALHTLHLDRGRLFDVWHPDLTETEISAIQEMFREVQARRDARKPSG